MVASDGVKPGTSALVLSASSSLTPILPNPAKAPRSVVVPSIGVGSSLKSPEWTISPSSVSNTTPVACGTLWATATRAKRNGPCSIHSPGLTALKSAEMFSSSTLLRASSTVSGVP